MDRQHYNRLKIVLAEKEKTGTWLSEQMGRNIGTVSRWMTNKVIIRHRQAPRRGC